MLKLKSVKDLIKIFGCVKDLMTFSKKEPIPAAGNKRVKTLIVSPKIGKCQKPVKD